jgi:hypothetical protein
MMYEYAQQAVPWIKDKVTYCRGLPALVFLLTFAVAATAFWQFVVRAEALSYGAPKLTYFKIKSDPDDAFALLRRERNHPTQVTEGDAFELCFAGIRWWRLCPGVLSTHLTPTFGSRIDFPSYRINTPAEKGPVDPKCRGLVAPALNGRTGPFTFGGHASFTCTLDGAPDIILPALKLDIRKKS